MIMGLDLEKLVQNLKASDLDDLMRIAKEMDWDALRSSSREPEWEVLKQSLGEGDLKEALSLLKEMDLEGLIESSKSSSMDRFKEGLKGLDLKKGTIALGLILMARKAVAEISGFEGREGEVKATAPEATRVTIESETREMEAISEDDKEKGEKVKYNLVGSSGSDKYHRPDCGLAKRISPKKSGLVFRHRGRRISGVQALRPLQPLLKYTYFSRPRRYTDLLLDLLHEHLLELGSSQRPNF